MNNEILRLPDVRKAVGLSTTTIWRLQRAGLFPARLRLSANAVGWKKAEIEKWIESRSPVTGVNGGGQHVQ